MRGSVPGQDTSAQSPPLLAVAHGFATAADHAGKITGAACAIMSVHAAVAQLAEQRTFNPKRVGSSPTGGTAKAQFSCDDDLKLPDI